MNNKKTKIFILLLISFIFVVLIIRYSNRLIFSVSEFFNPVISTEKKTENNSQDVSSQQLIKQFTTVDEIDSEQESDNGYINLNNNNKSNETFPIGGLDLNEECPHYDGQYYAFDNTCRPCKPGEFIDYKSKKCKLCPKDTFSEHRNSLKCKPCPYGYVTNNLIGQNKCEKPYNTTDKLRNLISKNHRITIDRVKQQKMQNIELNNIKKKMSEMMDSLENIKYSDDPTNLSSHKQNKELIKAIEVGNAV